MHTNLTRKKFSKKKGATPLMLLLLSFFLLVVLLSPFSKNNIFAQTEANQIEQAISTTSSKIQGLEKEIAKFRQEAKKVGAEKKTLETAVAQINVERKKILSEISLTDSQINKTRYTLDELRDEIDVTEEVIGDNKQAIAATMRALYEKQDFGIIETIAFADITLSEAFSEIYALNAFQAKLRDKVYDLRNYKVDLSDQKNEFLTEEEELAELRGKIVEQKKVVDSQKQQKDSLLRETRNQEAEYQKLIAEREALRKAFEQELFAYESKLQFILDPTIIPRRGTEPLSWPLDMVLVTQLFGAKTGPHRTYKNGHSGVDMRANGDPVYAMADGVVGGTGDTDFACKSASFGKWVFLRYDNNLASTYGHLSVISVQKGQRIKRGQIVGFSGNTGRSTAPHLHTSLYAAVDARGQETVRIEGKESNACKGKILIQPRASIDAYLNLLDYTPVTTDKNYKAGVR